MSKPRLLDLFCGAAGGCSVGYNLAGFEVVGVDIESQPSYPFEFHQADALTFPLGGFDAIHASPPCQDYSKAMRHLAAEQPRLIDPVAERLKASGAPWAIENVIGAPLPAQSDLFGRHGVELCGSMFGLPVWRHRLFELSLPIVAPRGCDHSKPAMNPHNQAGRDRNLRGVRASGPGPALELRDGRRLDGQVHGSRGNPAGVHPLRRALSLRRRSREPSTGGGGMKQTPLTRKETPAHPVNFGAQRAAPRDANRRGHGTEGEASMQDESIRYGYCQCGCGARTKIATPGSTRAIGPGLNPTGICQCGCGGITELCGKSNARKGEVVGTHRRFIKGHHRRGSVAPVAGYVIEDRGYSTPCWVWALATDRQGYAKKSDQNGKKRGAHTVFWETRNGPVPTGLELDHLCRVRNCVNPEHLEPVTSRENIRRSSVTKLRAADVLAIRASSETTKALAARYGISEGNVYHVRQGHTWTDIHAA